MNMRLILNGYRTTAVWIPTTDFLRLLFVALDDERCLPKEGGYSLRDQLFARILDAAARINKCENQLKRTTRNLQGPIADGTDGLSRNVCRELPLDAA
jgi:hypothetical protein